MRSPSARERGSVTAEFVVVLPAVVLVVVTALCALQLGAAQVRLQGTAASAARSLGRGDAPAAMDPGDRIAQSRHDGLVCVTATRSASGSGVLALVTLAATSCALGGGR